MARNSISAVTPRERIEAEVARRGRTAVADDCIALLRGDTELTRLRSVAGEGSVKYFDGRVHDDIYWFRVWALRGLLWSWDPRAVPEVTAALHDEHWRAREMAAKVVARHLVDEANNAVAALRDDPNPRVRQAAERALMRLTRGGG
jgi:HEAT repeat protein